MKLARGVAAAAGVVLGVWVAAMVGHSAISSPPAAAPAGTLMPAAGGPIDDLAIQFHRDGEAIFLPVYEQLLGALTARTTVHVLVEDERDERIFREAMARWDVPPSVLFAHTGRPITSWARDRLAVLRTEPGDSRAVLVAPPRPQVGPEERAHDWLVPWTLRAHLAERAAILTAPFVFDGGDLIADERTVFVATPLFERNPDVDPEILERQIAELTGLSVQRIGGPGVEVPDHHIGMFLTPLGGGRVAYGEPKLALAALPDEVSSLHVGGSPLELDLSPDRLRRFENVGTALREGGFDAVPVPLLPARGKHVYLSYDNVLMEHRADGLHVLLPVYGVTSLDAAATSAWQQAGATVHPIRVDGLFRLGGSVRCLVAPLRRG